MGIPDSIRVRFERPCPEDDVQCGQHGSSGFLWASRVPSLRRESASMVLLAGPGFGMAGCWVQGGTKPAAKRKVLKHSQHSQHSTKSHKNQRNTQEQTKDKEHRNRDSSFTKTTWHVFFLQELSWFTREIYEVRQEAEGRMAVLECQWYLAHGLRSEQSSMFPSLREKTNFEEGHINKTHQSKVFSKDSRFLSTILIPS